MAIAMPAYQQESASPIGAWILDAERTSFLRSNRYAKIQDEHISDEHHGLDWHTRYKIIKGTCEGLAYLHRQLEPRFYHLDLKPADILLDVNMDGVASTKCDVLERMLFDESVNPIYMPLSLLKYITNSFSEDKVIGRGGFGVVYKGMLSNGTIAVKKLSDIHLHENEFHKEVACLMKAKHKNVVRFLGYCADTQGRMESYNEKLVMADVQQRLLCFEYLSKGSLYDYITDASHELEWTQYYQIIKGICTGLHYLHENHIVHLDLKPSNVLLDDNMVPKIADFGISRCFDENQSRVITSKRIGSIGYLAPEFHCGRIGFKSDIFSLGVIITEILTGERTCPEDYDILERWGNRLEQLYREKQLEQLRVCAEIGKECTEYDPRRRPDALTIVRRLDEVDMVEWSPSSASRNVYEAGWVPAEHNPGLSQFARAFGIIPVETVDRSSHNSLAVLFEKSTKKVTSSNVSSTQRAGRDIFVVDSGDCMSDAAEMKTLTTTCFTSSNMDNAPTGADLVDLANSSGTSMLPPGASLHQQLALNNLADERNDKPRSNSAPSDTSSDQTARVAKKHKLTDDESPNNSDPNSCVAERDTNEEAKRSGKWYVASGATQHATGDRGVITNLQELENNDLCVHAADGMPMPVRGIGNVVTDTVVLPDVYYVPGLWTNLVSVGQLAGLDYCVGFGRGSCVVNDPAGTVVGRAHAGGDGLYEVEFLRVPFAMP